MIYNSKSLLLVRAIRIIFGLEVLDSVSKFQAFIELEGFQVWMAGLHSFIEHGRYLSGSATTGYLHFQGGSSQSPLATFTTSPTLIVGN